MTVSRIQIQPGDVAVFSLKYQNSIFEPEGVVPEIFERLRRGSLSLSIDERDLVSTDGDVYSRGQTSTLSGEVSGELSQIAVEPVALVGRFP